MPKWLSPFDQNFPADPEAFADREGLVAWGGDLSPDRLLAAYRQGLFPWFEDELGQPYWFCPDPRLVLFPSEVKIQKSMRSIFNQKKFEITFDRAFSEVIENCRTIQRGPEHGGTSWISEDFVAGYSGLHEHGLAHSVEVWKDGTLVGGLYGVSLGRVFFGESMFSKMPNASKTALISMVQKLEENGFWLIDCQVKTEHLASLGAREVPRSWFLDILKRNAFEPTAIGKWTNWLA